MIMPHQQHVDCKISMKYKLENDIIENKLHIYKKGFKPELDFLE